MILEVLQTRGRHVVLSADEEFCETVVSACELRGEWFETHDDKEIGIDWTRSRRAGWLDVDMGVSTLELRGWLSLLMPVSGTPNCCKELENMNLAGGPKTPVDSSRVCSKSVDE